MTEQLSALENFFEEARTMTEDDDLVQGMVVVSLSTGETLRGRVEHVERGMTILRPVVRRRAGFNNEHLVEGCFPVRVATEYVVYAGFTDRAMECDCT